MAALKHLFTSGPQTIATAFDRPHRENSVMMKNRKLHYTDGLAQKSLRLRRIRLSQELVLTRYLPKLESKPGRYIAARKFNLETLKTAHRQPSRPRTEGRAGYDDRSPWKALRRRTAHKRRSKAAEGRRGHEGKQDSGLQATQERAEAQSPQEKGGGTTRHLQEELTGPSLQHTAYKRSSK